MMVAPLIWSFRFIMLLVTVFIFAIKLVFILIKAVLKLVIAIIKTVFKLIGSLFKKDEDFSFTDEFTCMGSSLVDDLHHLTESGKFTPDVQDQIGDVLNKDVSDEQKQIELSLIMAEAQNKEPEHEIPREAPVTTANTGFDVSNISFRKMN